MQVARCRGCGRPLPDSAIGELYCSEICEGAATRADRLARHKEPPGGSERECDTCGGKFYRDPAKRSQRYCTPACKPNYNSREYRLMSMYGIGEDEYDRMLADQKGLCAICKEPPGERRLAVDHDHETGLVRGLLCGSCNLKLGWLEKRRIDIELYLSRPQGAA